MDFFQFLQNSNNNTELTKNTNTNVNNKNINNKNENANENNENVNVNVNNENVNNENDNINSLDTYKNLRKGNFVTIVYKKDSSLNCYKGYFGEVKDYRKNQEHALIFLHASNNCAYIKFPLTHFILHDNYN